VKVHLNRIKQEPLSFCEQLQLEPERLDEDQVAGTFEVRLEGVVRPADDRFHISGSVSCTGKLRCSRCLTDVSWTADEEYSLELLREQPVVEEAEVGLEPEDLDVVVVDADELDLRDLAAEQVLLAMPMRILCREQCAGLCPTCGANRNQEGACTCDPETDPRWAALEDLRGRPG